MSKIECDPVEQIAVFFQVLMDRYEGKTREKSKMISGETSLAEERVCGLHIPNSEAIEQP